VRDVVRRAFGGQVTRETERASTRDLREAGDCLVDCGLCTAVHNHARPFRGSSVSAIA